MGSNEIRAFNHNSIHFFINDTGTESGRYDANDTIHPKNNGVVDFSIIIDHTSPEFLAEFETLGTSRCDGNMCEDLKRRATLVGEDFSDYKISNADAVLVDRIPDSPDGTYTNEIGEGYYHLNADLSVHYRSVPCKVQFVVGFLVLNPRDGYSPITQEMAYDELVERFVSENLTECRRNYHQQLGLAD